MSCIQGILLGWGEAQLVECLPSMPEALGSALSLHRTGHTRTYGNPTIWEAEERVQGQLLLQSQFKVRLGDMRLCLKKEKENPPVQPPRVSTASGWVLLREERKVRKVGHVDGCRNSG